MLLTLFKLKIPSHFICHQAKAWAVGPVPWLAICNFFPCNFILLSLISALYHVFLSETNMKYVWYRLREINDFDFDLIWFLRWAAGQPGWICPTCLPAVSSRWATYIDSDPDGNFFWTSNTQKSCFWRFFIERMKNVNEFSPTRDLTGYDKHDRGLVLGLYPEADPDPECWSNLDPDAA